MTQDEKDLILFIHKEFSNPTLKDIIDASKRYKIKLTSTIFKHFVGFSKIKRLRSN